MNEGAPAPRLVSFLGTGDYQEVTYSLDALEALPTRWIVLALAQVCEPPPAEIYLIVTPESQGRVADVAAALRTAGLPAPMTIEVPSRGNPLTLWQQFDRIKAALRTDDNRPVFLDITHGFRSQPFFAAAVVAFIRAVDHDQPPMRVFYGAFEARDPATGRAPIWELTAFVELLDWAREIMLFLQTGRAAEVAGRTETLDRALRSAWSAAGKHPKDRLSLDRLAKALAEFGGDLETIRTGALLLGDAKRPGSAARLLDALAVARPAAAAVAPPLADVLDRIETMATPLPVAAPTLAGPEGHEALVALARLYVNMGRFAEAATIVREGWVCRYADEAAAAPGIAGYSSEAREAAEERWKAADCNLGRRVAGIRNDINHAGFGRRPERPDVLKREVGKLLDGFAGAPRVFANLSNHASVEWSEAQRAAALAYADRIEDVAFPAVPPGICGQQFDRLLKATLACVPAATSHAMVQGEFTLCFALVRELQRRGIVCFAAATDRNVDFADDAKLSRFDFVRFREYPCLAAR